MKTCIGMMICSAALAGSLRAEPFRVDDVASDAAWVVHMDIEALKGTRVGDFLLAEMNRKEAAAKLKAIKAVFNFDPREDLLSATLYGADQRPEKSVAILRGRFDAERLVTLVQINGSYERTRSGRHEIHSWIDENKTPRKRVFAGFQGNDTLVVSESRSRVIGALDVLNGAAESLAADSRLAASIQDSGAAFFMAAANMAEMPEVAPQAALLRKARAFQLSMTAPGDTLQGSLRMSADSSRTAELVEQIVVGMVAFAQLNDIERPDLAALAQTVRILRSGNAVECSLSHPIDEVVAYLQHEAERKRDAANGS